MSIEIPRLDGALCAETDPELFFPEKGGSTRTAKELCRSCPAAAECLEFALTTGERFGIWGGQSERNRRVTAKERGIVAEPINTYGGHGEVTDRRIAVRRLRALGLDGPTIAERLSVPLGVIYADFQAIAAQDLTRPDTAA